MAPGLKDVVVADEVGAMPGCFLGCCLGPLFCSPMIAGGEKDD